MIPRAAAVLLFVALSQPGCTEEAAVADVDPDLKACMPSTEGVQHEYVQAASWGGDSAGFERIGGIAESDDRVYVYDAAHPRVVVLDTALMWQVYFGRSGDVPPRLGGGSWRWIGAGSDTVHVFDGRRLTWFDPSGGYLGSASPSAAGAMGRLNSRVLHTTSGVLYAHGGYDLNTGSADEPALALRLHERRGDVYRMELAPWPRTRDGVPWGHPAQARPLWDAAGRCAWLSDGASGDVVVMDVETRAADTIAVDLPNDRIELDNSAVEAVRGSMGAQSPLPDPTLVVRIVDMIVDPERRVWLLLRGSEPDDLKVVHVTGRDGRSEMVSPPAWPRAFGQGGSFYAIETDSLDVLRVRRYIPRIPSARAGSAKRQ